MTEAKKIRTLPLPKLVEKLVAERAAAVTTIADIDAKLPALQEQLASIQAELDARKDIDVTGLNEGVKVAFDYGRGESRKELTGRVIAFAAKTDSSEARYRIETGEGMETTSVTVFASAVNRVVPAI